MNRQNVVERQSDQNLHRQEDSLELIAIEYAELLQQGYTVSPEEFAARYRDQDARLLELLKSIRWIQLAARGLDESSDQFDPPTDRDFAKRLTRLDLRIDQDNPVCLGDYQLIRELGRGGMGIVFEAEQIALSRRVAVKILPPTSVLNERHVARFAMESQAAAQLQHPNIVPIFSVGHEAGVYFYSMQLIEGGCPSGPMPPSQVAAIGACVAGALNHAHEMGIVHRDVKPSNLLVDSSGKVWVTDFGLARCLESDQATVSGAVLGTLRYMSPEQASGSAAIDHRSDIYSLGVTLYELLTGRCPFDTSNRAEFLAELVRGEPLGLRRLDSSIPMDLETIVHKAMSSEPHLRYPTAQAMADDLTRFLNGEVILARRPALRDRFSKWVLRNRRWVTAAAIMWSLTSIAAIFAVVLLLRAEHETTKALEQTQMSLKEADIFFSQAREVVDHFGITLSRQLAEIPGAESTRRELLRDTLGYYRDFMNQAERNPSRQREVATTYLKLGRVAEQMEALDEAVEAYNRSELLWKSIAPDDPDRALCANLLGMLLVKMGNRALADDAFKVAIDCNQRIFLADPTNWEAKRRYAVTLTNSTVSQLVSDPQRDEKSLKAALELQQELIANRQLDNRMRVELLVDAGKTNGALAALLRSSDNQRSRMFSQQCIDCLEAAIQNSDELKESHQTDFELTKQQAAEDLVLALCNHASIVNDAGAVSLAIANVLRATELGNRMCNDFNSLAAQENLAAAYNLLARLYCSQHKYLDQIESFQRASNLLTGLVKTHEHSPEYRVDLATVSYNLQRSSEQLSAHTIASKAQVEFRVQYQWLRDNAPPRAIELTELIETLKSQQGQL